MCFVIAEAVSVIAEVLVLLVPMLVLSVTMVKERSVDSVVP